MTVSAWHTRWKNATHTCRPVGFPVGACHSISWMLPEAWAVGRKGLRVGGTGPHCRRRHCRWMCGAHGAREGACPPTPATDAARLTLAQSLSAAWRPGAAWGCLVASTLHCQMSQVSSVARPERSPRACGWLCTPTRCLALSLPPAC